MILVLWACGPAQAPEPAVPFEVQTVVHKALLGAEAMDPRLSPEVQVHPDVTWTDGPWDQLSLYARRYRSGTGAPLEPIPFVLGSSVRHF
jgi:hypothetical protein